MTRAPHSPWLHRFAIATAVTTLMLIGLGGLVTSHGAGMAVPDWPTSYGYNMFLLPVSKWIGGVFYEHTHRLLAAFVGLLTMILAAWIWGRETTGRARWAGWLVIGVLVAMLSHRGSANASGGLEHVPVNFKILAVTLPFLLVFGVVQCFRSKWAVRWLAMTAYFAVIFQGMLGGLRVAMFKQEIGIFHATLAQLFLILVAAIALVTSRKWRQLSDVSPDANGVRFQRLFAAVSVLILVQLILGASMRHQHNGLAVPDFPLAYGQVWPDMDEEALESINRNRVADYREFGPVTAFQIGLHMAHRVGALAILASVLFVLVRVVRRTGWNSGLSRLATFWFSLIVLQALLGAWTVWSNKAADIATLHVVLGALSLVTGAMLALVSSRMAGSSNAAEVGAKSSVLRDDARPPAKVRPAAIA